MKVKWISKQFTRFDLALVKLSRPLTAINTLSNLSVAITIGFLLFGTIALIGFVGIAILGYMFHRAGFFMETMNETFDQQSKELWYRQQRYLAAAIAMFSRKDDEDLAEILEDAKRELNL